MAWHRLSIPLHVSHTNGFTKNPYGNYREVRRCMAVLGTQERLPTLSERVQLAHR